MLHSLVPRTGHEPEDWKVKCISIRKRAHSFYKRLAAFEYRYLILELNLMGKNPKGAVIPVLNLKGQYQALQDEIQLAIQKVLSTQSFILGENVAALEEEIAQYCGVAYGVGVASGTDALLLALKAAGVGPGDEVIVPAFSFVATADVVGLLGAVPVFVDIDPASYTIDVSQVKASITPNTRAVIPVHLYGQPANMAELLTICEEHGLTLIGDTAQALGADYHESPVCSFGDFGCISFFPSKNLGAYGDGGMIVVKQKEQADLLKKLRSHGSSVKYCSEIQGWNSRLDEIQAAILRVKLPYLDQWNLIRAEHAAMYNQILGDVDGLIIPKTMSDRTHVFHQYTVRVPNRDAVRAMMLESGIETAVHYPIPLHLQPMYRSLGYRRGDLPVAEKAAEEVLSLPVYPELEDSQIERISLALRAAVESQVEVLLPIEA
ncbi:Glutamine--scyllo-inositol transaminase [Granulicella mallensis MP5ACTX8]|uniref:Glutamine--scyllo-inositol transaminase n=2 Tax=Granulicella mallensis TaxID=940614 RepID=G8NXB5_GRAMM|nr:Glutamine--scyllo-inositol transaminase [Granulicella mallensis MP5ACTX8]